MSREAKRMTRTVLMFMCGLMTILWLYALLTDMWVAEADVRFSVAWWFLVVISALAGVFIVSFLIFLDQVIPEVR